MSGNSAPNPQQHGLDVVEDEYGLDDFSRSQPTAAPGAAAAHPLTDEREPDLDLGLIDSVEMHREPVVESQPPQAERRTATESIQNRQPPTQRVPPPENTAPTQATMVSRFAKHKWNIAGAFVAVALCTAVLLSRLPSSSGVPVVDGNQPISGQPGPFEQRVQPQHAQTPVVESLKMDQHYPAEPAVIPEPEYALAVQPVAGEANAATSGIVQPAVDSRTEEERYYDNMAAAAGNSGEVVTAQASIQMPQQPPVVAQPTADTRFGEVSEQLSRTSADIVKVLSAVQQLKSELAVLQQKVNSDSGKTSAMALRLDNMSTNLATFEKTYNQKLEDVSKAAAKAAISALAKGSKKDDKLVLTGGPMVSVSAPHKPQVAPRQAVQAKPQEPLPAVAKGPTNACDGKPISQVWAVKGVSTGAAFIRREADGFGTMVNKDSQVLGFGTVISFDPANRVVCTTSGKIVQR